MVLLRQHRDAKRTAVSSDQPRLVSQLLGIERRTASCDPGVLRLLAMSEACVSSRTSRCAVAALVNT